MLKVLIVDDDIVVRTNLKTLINWNLNGFEIYGEASNGFDAIQKMEKAEYHIVITDMSMPIMDGIALIEHIEQNCQGVKVIALSGFNDFEYVSQSFKKGAIDYILKHKLDEETLLHALKAAQKDILAERHDVEQKQRQREQLYQSRTVLVQRFINKLVKGQIIDKRKIQETIDSLNISLGMRNLVVIAAEIDGFFLLKEQNIDVLIQSFLNISEEVLKDFGEAIISYSGDGRFVIIAHLGKTFSYLYIHKRLLEIIDRIKSSIKRYLSFTLTFGVSNVCEDICDIAKYYLDAEKALHNKFYAGRNRVLWSNVEHNPKEMFMSLDIKDEKFIVDHLRLAERQEVLNQLEIIFERVISSNASYKSVQMICAELFNIVSKTSKECGVADPFTNANTETPYEILKRYDTIQDIKLWIFSIFEELILFIESTKANQSYTVYTKKAIEFINKNYSRNISLADTAEYVGVSSQYLSTVFKEDCNTGFIDYLNHYRVERAKWLLQNSNNKLKEIIGMVGFNNYNYFFKVFKEITLMTPTEFEKLYKR